MIHFGTGASGFFRELHAAGGDVMGVDWRINIDQAWMDISYRSAIQGNLDPVALFAPLPELQGQGARAAEAHRHASRPHLQSRPRHSAGNAGREREGRGGNGPGIPAVNAGVLLLAHGAPERIEDVPEYLSYVRGGQPVSAARAGRSSQPLRGDRRQLSADPLDPRAGRSARRQLLGIPVFFGMRNWHPFVKETMEQVRAAGIGRLACVCLAPQFSEMSVGLYMKHAQSRRRRASSSRGPTAITMSRC